MTREEKIESIMDRCTFTDDDYWLCAMRRGLEIGYDARDEDYKKMTCKNCKYYINNECIGSIKIYDEEKDEYLPLSSDFYCNRWEAI